MREETKERADSYGMLQINRISGNGNAVLFGSSITHNETIRLSIHPGTVTRTLNHDWYYAEGKAFIEVEMSQAQFAEAITSMNMGSGVPVTIRRLNGKGVEHEGFVNKRVQFEQEFRERMEKLEQSLRHLTEESEDLLRNKKSLNKGDRESILSELNRLKMEISSNIPFMMSSYNEQLDKTSKEAKAEIEAFTINKINQLGLTKLQELQALDNPDETPVEKITHKNQRSE